MNLPSKSGLEHARTRFDDLQAVHQRQGDVVHITVRTSTSELYNICGTYLQIANFPKMLLLGLLSPISPAYFACP